MELQPHSDPASYAEPHSALLDPALLCTLLASTARKILEEKDLTRVLQAICEEACSVLRADRAMVTKVHIEGKGVRREIAYAHNYPPEFIEALQATRADSILADVIRSGGIEVIPLIEDDPRVFDAGAIRRAGHRTVCFLPLLIHEPVPYGALVLVHLTQTDYSADDLKLAEAFGELASIAIENSRLHEEARRSRDFFRSVVDDNAEAIVISDLERKVICWNRGAESLFGYTEQEASGRSILDLIVLEEDKAEWNLKYKENMKDFLRNGKLHLAETRRRRKDGAVISVEITISPVKNDRGEIVAFCAFCKDLAEWKRAEEILIESKVVAEKANQTKSEFLSNVSHELRSPLNSVIGFSELLMQKTKDEEVLRLLPKIRDAGKYLTRLIDDLRDVDRIESSKMKLDLEDVVLNDLVENMIDSWTANLADGYSIVADLDPGCGRVGCDPVRVRQILNNMLDNAVKYSPDPCVIRVRTQAKITEMWISVQDRGLGLGPGEREVIFDRFRQLERGNVRSSGGMGIGLYLVRQLVTMHGGHIWVDSEKGRGSTFTFSLPCRSVDEEEGGWTGAHAGAAPGEEELWAGRSILLVDDLEMFHMYIKMLMGSAAGLHSAYNGREGVEMARRLRPDIILMDLRMPVMNGYEAIERLKADPETRDIPIIAVTAQAMREDMDRCRQVGAEGYVTKPIDKKFLAKEVGRLVRDGRG